MVSPTRARLSGFEFLQTGTLLLEFHVKWIPEYEFNIDLNASS
jgi:hypothetical protein